MAEDARLEPGELGEEVAPVELADQLVVRAQLVREGVESLADGDGAELEVVGEPGGAGGVGGVVPHRGVGVEVVRPPEDRERLGAAATGGERAALRQQLPVDLLREGLLELRAGEADRRLAGRLRHRELAGRLEEGGEHPVGRAAAGHHLPRVGEQQVVATVKGDPPRRARLLRSRPSRSRANGV